MKFDDVYREYNSTFPDDPLYRDMYRRKFIIQPNDQSLRPRIMPQGETVETMHDRILRSKEIGKNLFLDEWEEAPALDPLPDGADN